MPYYYSQNYATILYPSLHQQGPVTGTGVSKGFTALPGGPNKVNLEPPADLHVYH